MKVAIIAPPWLALPIKGYGGIELVLEGLIDGLKHQGVEIELFANGQRKIRGVKTHSLFKTEQFQNIHKPYYETVPIIQAHMTYAINKIREAGDFDIIHDHSTLVGPTFFSLTGYLPNIPPVVHTFHGPPFTSKADIAKGDISNRLHLEQINDFGQMYMVCISKAMTKTAPKAISDHLLAPVHNAIDPKRFPFKAEKKDYFITLARFDPDKGQDVAAKLAVRLKKRLRMAGTVAGIGTNRKLLSELSNPLSSYRGNEEFRYFSDKVLPYILNYPRITYAGNLSGKRKMKFVSEAKALLFPIDWEEPFGMAVIEALACGTPVVAMDRGAMPEIIEHGVNGFLAKNEEEFASYMERVEEIDPVKCRESVEKKFSADAMAAEYVKRYEEAIQRSKEGNIVDKIRKRLIETVW